ncbi:iron ABC transporter permease [Pseudoalteromonas ruthenica]|uniref:ABC transporter permease n=1 Tax=Pseudoalteromonas ruthenica TaxID=151081 RepID=A0A0F4PZN5_9GAMM|nr:MULTISPECIES: iron ABC transporter permease [Pseudoalteromonas]KJY95552.1 ABC transporter permease [Pseudoalteromonas ruthenica]KJZ00560.1 ABC transporter permease [Pseudoalteromonas ruthenica]MCF2860579.1 iron ABC transporter permease [Pseudoalteromonas sp. CNAT2-18]MCG7556448.1 iron ABC transporter permease [Pseudoalteromonas sp. CNAT2-18.1]MCG7565711.1 iron ABC transporter permease [Pseudoalteromonas sp. CnMc7-15]
MRLPASYPLALLAALVALTPVYVLLSLASDANTLFDSHNLEILGNTLALMALTVLGSILIGVPLAFISAYVHLPLKKFWLVLFAAPLAIPSYIGAFTLYAAFGPGGEIEGLFGLTTAPMYGLSGAAIVMTLYTFPFVMMTTRSSLLSLDASMVNAARTLGMSMTGSIFKVILPRVVNGIAAGSLLVALYTLSDFGTPAMMRLDTFTRVIYVEYNAFGLNRAAMLSLQLMCIVGFLLFLESQIKTATERHGRALILFPSRLQLMGLFTIFTPILMLAIGLPLAIFMLWLARDGVADFDINIAWNSAYASIIAALTAVIVAIPVAHAALTGKAGRIMERVTYFGFGIPGIVMGTALVYGGLQLPLLYQTLALLVIAYVLRFLPLAVGSIRTSTEHLDGSLVKSARVLGASPREAFMRVTLPLTARGIVAGAALVFLESMRELEATLLLGPTGFETLSTYLWRVYEAGYFGRAAIPGLLLVVISAGGLAIMLSGEKRSS